MDRGSSHEKRMRTHTVSDLATGLQSQGYRGSYREVSEPGNKWVLEHLHRVPLDVDGLEGPWLRTNETIYAGLVGRSEQRAEVGSLWQDPWQEVLAWEQRGHPSPHSLCPGSLS